jgi:putative salt-induced outer membrane protein YdiY
MSYGSLMRVCALCGVALLAAARTASAQLVIPPAKAPRLDSHPVTLAATDEKDADQWTGKAEVSYVSTSGNADTTTARVGSELQYAPDGWTFFLRGAFLTSTSETTEKNRRIDGLLRASHTLGRGLEAFGQVTYLRNTFAGIGSSVYPLGGLAYTVIDGKPHTLTARLGFGYGQESRVRQPELNFATADAQTAYRWALSKTAEFREDAVYTRNLSRGSDWRLANVASVAAALNSLLSLKVSHSLNYLNQPVSGFERVDTVTSAALVATF